MPDGVLTAARHLAEAIEAGAQPDAQGRALVVQALRAFAAISTRQRAAALQRASRRRRDELLRELARVHYDQFRTIRARVAAIRKAASIYETGRWRIDRHAVTCPRESGTVQALLWAIFKEGTIPGDRQLREILGRGQ